MMAHITATRKITPGDHEHRGINQALVSRHEVESRSIPGLAHPRRSSQSANPLNFSPEAGIDESRKFDGVARKRPVEK